LCCRESNASRYCGGYKRVEDSSAAVTAARRGRGSHRWIRNRSRRLSSEAVNPRDLGANPRDPSPHQAGQRGRVPGSASALATWNSIRRRGGRAAGGAAGLSDFGGIQSAGSSAARGGRVVNADRLGDAGLSRKCMPFDRSIDTRQQGWLRKVGASKRTEITSNIRELDTVCASGHEAKK